MVFKTPPENLLRTRRILLKVIPCRHTEMHPFSRCLICKRDNFFPGILFRPNFRSGENSKRFEFGSFSSFLVVQMANQRLLPPLISSLKLLIRHKL